MNRMRDLYVIAHDMRSTFNVGSLFRTAEGLGIKKIYLSGYTPYPKQTGDTRLPHISDKLTTQIQKTALNATETMDWEYEPDVFKIIHNLEASGVTVAALEQTEKAVSVVEYKAPPKLALLLGTEVTGLPEEIYSRIKAHLVIPMHGKKESFNVVQAAAMALFELRFH